MNQCIVAMQDVGYKYPDNTTALQKISFSLVPGESVALIGGNGAGKSTMLSLLLGIVFPTEGTVSISGLELNRKTATAARRRIGMVFQNPDDQLFMPTVYDDVAFGPLNMGFSQEQTAKRVTEALEKVGALHLQRRSSQRLSVGEKRAVAIASVLSMTPEILLLDEPTAGLDPWSRRQLIVLLRQFTQTMIIATHDLDFVQDVCQRAIVLQRGWIIADGPAEHILRDRELLESCRLELPLRLQAATD